MGAALMRSGWLKGRFSLRHYRRTGALLVAAGMAVNLPAIFAQWYLAWDYRWCAFLLQAPRELRRPAAGYRLCRAGLGLLAATLPFPPGGRYRLRRTHGADQLPAADPDLHHPVLSSWAVYALRSSAAAGLCPPIWAVNLLVSSLWLRRFRQGPVEWLWRQLTLRASGTSLKDTSR